MQPITFGAAYFFTDNYLNGYDKQENIPTRRKNEAQFINHLAQTTGDSFTAFTGYAQSAEKSRINHPQLGLGYAVVTNKITNNFSDYFNAKEYKRDDSMDGHALIEALDEANERGELQRFDVFEELEIAEDNRRVSGIRV